MEPFSGERYSLVFFCTGAVNRAREEALSFVRLCGAHVPTSATLRQPARYLCPAKGYDMRGKQQLGIREMFGREVRPSSKAWKVPCLMELVGDCLDKCLSFVISPMLMSSLCAVAKVMSMSCWRPSSWHGVVVDAAGQRPEGRLALTQFKLWSSAKAVVGGSSWERGNVSFLIDRTWTAWSFVNRRGTDVLVSRCPVPSQHVAMSFDVRSLVQGKVFVGIASGTNCHLEIASLLAGRPPVAGVVAVAAALSNGRCRAFRCNGKWFGPSAPPIGHLRGIVQLSLGDRRRLRFEVPGCAPIEAKTPVDLPVENTYHSFVVLPFGCHHGVVRPCWSRTCA